MGRPVRAPYRTGQVIPQQDHRKWYAYVEGVMRGYARRGDSCKQETLKLF